MTLPWSNLQMPSHLTQSKRPITTRPLAASIPKARSASFPHFHSACTHCTFFPLFSLIPSPREPFDLIPSSQGSLPLANLWLRGNSQNAFLRIPILSLIYWLHNTLILPICYFNWNVTFWEPSILPNLFTVLVWIIMPGFSKYSASKII